jgi:hypothetical protein
MTKTTLLGAAALIAALTATPALAQHAMHRGHAHHHHHHGWSNNSGFWPGAIVGGAIGTAAAIATSPYRNSYAYYGSGPQYDDTYAYYGNRRGATTCGVEPYATYMGPDGRWYPC